MLNWQYLVLINLAPNLTTQIKLLHSFDTEGLVFKTAWGFPIFSMVRLQFFHQGCLSKLHFFFYYLLQIIDFCILQVMGLSEVLVVVTL